MEKAVKDFETILNELNTNTITHLDTSTMSPINVKCPAFAKAFKRNSSLRSIKLSKSFNINFNYDILASFLEFNKKLEILDLSCCHLKDLALYKINWAIKLNPNLKEIFLNDNLISDIGVKALLEIFNKLVNIKNIDLSNNYMSWYGLENLLTAIEKNKNLKDLNLNLHSNHLGDRGIYILANFISRCDKIASLNVGSNQVSEKGATKIFKALKYNKNLIRLGVGNNKQISDSLQVLLDVMDERETNIEINITDLSLSKIQRNKFYRKKEKITLVSDIRTRRKQKYNE